MHTLAGCGYDAWMLTKDLAITEYDFARGRVLPDRLTQASHQQYAKYAERMLQVYLDGAGRTRRELHRAVHDVFSEEEDCPARRIDGFCKLLDDVSTYQRDRRGEAAKLRQRVFRMAAERHPLVERADRLFETDERQVKRDIAQRLGRSWKEIDKDLFADVIEFHRLEQFDGYADGRALLARYNVAQVQVALFSAVSMSIWAARDFKAILRYAKLARLMHTISKSDDGRYVFRFDGPASVLRQTRRYGVAMARFLPALISCRDWRLHAVIQTRKQGWSLGLDLTSEDGLHSPVSAPDRFDSNVEESLARKWGDEPREGWRLERETEVLHVGQKVFVPDFAFRHEDGRTALLEIVGFWTPEYLQKKLQTLANFSNHPIILAINQHVGKTMTELPAQTIVYKTTIHVKDVLARLTAVNSASASTANVDLGVR